MAKDPSLVVTVDFSNVKDSSGINPKHQDEGDYPAKIIKVEMTKTKGKDGKKPEPMALILFQDANMRSAVYPYYCTFADNQLWKIRNTFIAAGLPVPKNKAKIDLGKLIGKDVAISLEDDEYDGKMKSVISAVFHRDELEPTEDAADDDELEEDEDDVEVEEEEEEEEAPAPKAKKRKPAPAPEPEEDDEEEEDEEEEEPAPAPKRKAKAKPAPVVEDDEEDEDDDLDLDEL